MTVRQMAKLSLLASLCIALRFSFGAFPNIKPITAIFLVCLIYFKLWEVIVIMSLTMIITGIYMGFGIWILWQIIAYAIVLMLWQYLVSPLARMTGLRLPVLTILSGVMPFVYSLVIAVFDSWLYGTSLLAYWLNGLVFDYLHALSTIAFYPIVFYSLRRLFNNEKTYTSLFALVSVMTLAACSPAPTSVPANNQTSQVADDDPTAQATILVKFTDRETEKEVTFEVGDSVMDVLEDNFNVEEEDGLVTVIDGVSQDPAKNTYWMYKVNGEMAEVGAESYEVKAGDKIEFYLESF
ncbi:hypothetical protein ABID29_002263 [Streptococcus rupicaprae]|uniref:Transcobalamin-like C-terminal domain-containing protein n=1 Tax=Streptococcus rupicaprae TaxID=759619 RepID=A0ABV2FKM2_9STRE